MSFRQSRQASARFLQRASSDGGIGSAQALAEQVPRALFGRQRLRGLMYGPLGMMTLRYLHFGPICGRHGRSLITQLPNYSIAKFLRASAVPKSLSPTRKRHPAPAPQT